MTLRLRRDVSTADTGTGLVLLDQAAGRYWQLNPTGALVLRMLLDGVTEPEVARTLAERHAIEVERAGTDVTALVESLRAAKVVEEAAQ
ncbi:hypothetical protein GCM10023196_029840 [Actinoallomurus vinaceus]|uniref:Lasso peptide biosynthesis PqqD family chaperone n=1 Tax=Actinoallomurus vinaceus TaxID=1080074 RepID=A0ABP8UBU5_9ACTN